MTIESSDGEESQESQESLPRRRDFSCKKLRKKHVDKVIEKKDPLYFMPTSVSESLPFHDYVLYMHGSLLSGDKATVAVKNIPIFFDIRTPDGMAAHTFQTKLRLILKKIECIPTSIEKHEALGPRGFQRWGTYFRVFYKNLTKRKKAITYFCENKYDHDGVDKYYETAYDDRSCYYRKSCREAKFSMADWNKISYYSIDGSKSTSGADYVINCDVKDIEWFNVDKTADENVMFAKDKSMVMTWDIETHSYREDGSVPKPDDELDEIFMIGITFHWRGELKPLLKIGLCTKEMDARDYRAIHCKTEKELIRTFFQLIGNMMPDYIAEFNGGQYDWPWIIYRATQYNLLFEATKNMCIMKKNMPNAETVKKWNIKKMQVKLEADKKTDCTNIRFPGYECIDVRIKFRQNMQFKTAEESSLKFFLDACKLDSKLDMPYDELHRRFNRSDLDEKSLVKYVKSKNKDASKSELKTKIKEFKTKCKSEMAEVMDYCIVDALRCQELLLAKNVISDMREVGVRSFTSMYDCIYLADGMKVKNLILHEAIAKKIQFTTITRGVPKFKYPGAFVVDPETGLENTRPVTGLDFSSLYPSLIRAYNISPEYAVFTKEEADRLKKKGHVLHKVEFPGPNGTTIEGWTVRHDNKSEKTGIYPYILGYLFDQRADMKKIMKPFGHNLENLGVELNDKSKTPEELEEIKEKIESNKLKYDYIDAKQKALKVFMNTFYGMMGDVTSPLFMLLLAGAVTSAGQANIKMVAKYVEKRGYKIKYGDTDSLYIIPPDSVFKEVDKLYKKNKLVKLEYWTKMVELTMEDLEKFKNEVNDMLKADNGTVYLTMAYEEVLFPFISLTKKMYYGIPHEGVVNFFPKKLFVRGIATKKRGFPDFIKKLLMEIMWDSVSHENKYTLRELVENKLKEIPNRKWTLEDFIQTAEYRPSKDQKTLKAFVEQLPKRERPKPGKRFKYIVAEDNPFYTTVEGYKKNNNVKPNLAFYMQGVGGSGGMVIGQFARFISYHKDFDAPTDKERMNKAKSYMKKLCKGQTSEFKSNDKVCKEIYKKTATAVIDCTEKMYGESSSVLTKIKNKDNPKKDIMGAINREVGNKGRTKAFREDVFQACADLCKKYDPFQAIKLYTQGPDNIMRKRRLYIMAEMRKEEKKLDKVLPKVTKLSDIQNKSIEEIVKSMREKLDVENDKTATIADYGEEKFKEKVERKISKMKIPGGYADSFKELETCYENIKQLKMFEKWNMTLLQYLQYAKASKSGNDDPVVKIEPVKKEEIKMMVQDLDIPVY